MGARAELLERDSETYARLITAETRKTIRSARAEVAKCALVARFYAEHAAAMLADQPTDTGFIRFEPLGTILGVMPWNFPFWQVFRFAIPALLAGNSVIVKHSPHVPECAAALERLMNEAGFGGVFSAAALPAEAVYPLVADERVRAVVLTGGQEAGSAVAEFAGRHVKKISLELGGSDAFVVLPSADIERTVAAAVRSRMHCNGQACTAAKRFIVHRDVYDEFESRLVAAMSSLRPGDPFDERTDYGPLLNDEVASRLERQVEDTIALGATLLTGGRLGATFFAPTVLRGVPLDSPAAQEETFGPVAALFRANDVDDAIAIANNTRFGLGASVWTSERAEAMRCVAAIEAGQVFVNAIVSSDPRLLFGGTKSSGFGRELGVAGIRELTNVKTVVIG
ncbi:MAG TPA: aldehyde dehydrogenase family protein [Thermoanaerobaculia bacterium]|nr:aldehyde dehydrogenase family protein [Thermoanaerobaculia bacterium]